MQHPGLPVSSVGAGQRSACLRAPLPGEGADLLAEVGGGGDQDRSQSGAGGLAGLDGVVPVDHQQPQGFPVTVGAHLRGRRADQQLAGRADGVDRVALARPALPDVTAAVNLGHLLILPGEVAGQAQPVVPGSFHGPDDLPARGSRPDLSQELRVSRRRGRHLQLEITRPRASQIAAVCVSR